MPPLGKAVSLMTMWLCSLAYGEAGAQLPQSSCCEQSVLIAPRVKEFNVKTCDHWQSWRPCWPHDCEHFGSIIFLHWTDSNNSTLSGNVTFVNNIFKVSIADFPELYEPGEHHKITIYCTFLCHTSTLKPFYHFNYPTIQIDLYVYDVKLTRHDEKDGNTVVNCSTELSGSPNVAVNISYLIGSHTSCWAQCDPDISYHGKCNWTTVWDEGTETCSVNLGAASHSYTGNFCCNVDNNPNTEPCFYISEDPTRVANLTNSNSTHHNASSEENLPWTIIAGSIGGGVVGLAVAVLLVSAVIYCVFWRKRGCQGNYPLAENPEEQKGY